MPAPGPRHELNNLLQVAFANIELVRSRPDIDAVAAGRLDKAVAALDDALKLIGALAEAAAPACRPSRTSGRRLRIVLAEDDALVRSTMAALLADIGHEVVESSTGAEARVALAAGADLLITDLGLPDIMGQDLADEAIERMPGLAVVIATGESESPGSVYTWLLKPFSSAKLQAAIQAALGEPAPP